MEIYGQDVAAIFFPSPFFPSQFQNGTARTLYVRTGGEAGPLAPAIREIVAQIDPRVPLLELATLDEKIRSDTKFQGRRVLAGVAAVLGIVALLLASVGLYGVTSYSVAMRGREIAVRMALGARADRVVAMVLRQALAVATIGSVLGGLVGSRPGSSFGRRCSVSPESMSRRWADRRRCLRRRCSWPASCRPGGPPGWTRMRCCDKSRKFGGRPLGLERRILPGGVTLVGEPRTLRLRRYELWERER